MLLQVSHYIAETDDNPMPVSQNNCNTCYFHAVTLTSSADRVCPGDTVVFTCVTDTGRLEWYINKDNRQLDYSSELIGHPLTKDIFTLKLLNITGTNNSVFESTATTANVSLSDSGRSISCSDNPLGSTKERTIRIGKEEL